MCMYRYDRFTTGFKSTQSVAQVARDVLDIEELADLGRRNGPCPYYLAREIAETADIVFLPYNYLIDPGQRKNLPVSFTQSIVIFDEGHNIEVCVNRNVCERKYPLGFGSKLVTVCMCWFSNPVLRFHHLRCSHPCSPYAEQSWKGRTSTQFPSDRLGCYLWMKSRILNAI